MAVKFSLGGDIGGTEEAAMWSGAKQPSLLLLGAGFESRRSKSAKPCSFWCRR